jgi:hypothetical protein
MDAEKHPGISALATTVPLEVGEGDNINEKKPALVESSTFDSEDKQDVIIRTAQDAATHLLSLRDDFDPALTFRSMFLSTGLAAFQAVMYQIYMVSFTVRAPRPPCRSNGCYVVQTHYDHHSRYIHCHHCLLPWQGLGQVPPSW